MGALRSSIEVVGEALAGGESKAFQTPMSAAAAPYQIVDRRSSYGWSNNLIESSVQNQDRQPVTLVDYDIHRTVSSIGRRTLLSLARVMFWRIPALQAAILEQANLAVCPYTPVFRGRNKNWGAQASEWLQSFHGVMDLAGWPFDYDSYNELILISSIVDGDVFTLLTEDDAGNPRVQIIPSHRVGSRYNTGGVAKIKFTGKQLFIDGVLVDDNLPWAAQKTAEWEAPIVDGVILDGTSRALAYRVYKDPAVSNSYEDISARNLFPAFLPMIPGQVRNYSMLSSSVFDWQDVREYKSFEMLAQKVFASKTIVEQNETGDVDSSKAVISKAAMYNADGTKSTLDMQSVQRGMYHYFKAGSGSKLEAFDYSRPSRDAQAFQESTIRDAFRGTEWDAFFSLDPKNVGGAPLRVITDRINRVVRKRRRLASKNILRVDCYALAKAMKRGELPYDPDWQKWIYQGPTDVTADRRYDAQTDQMEYQLGWTTLEQIEARRNGDWLGNRTQREIEVRDLYTRAKKLADEFNIPIQEATAQLAMLGNTTITMQPDDGSNAQPAPLAPAPGKDK